MAIPVLSRLRYTDYQALIIGYIFVIAELILRAIVFLLPNFLVRWFTKQSRR